MERLARLPIVKKKLQHNNIMLTCASYVFKTFRYLAKC